MVLWEKRGTCSTFFVIFWWVVINLSVLLKYRQLLKKRETRWLHGICSDIQGPLRGYSFKSRNPTFFEHRKGGVLCQEIGKTCKNHPYIRMVMEQGDWLTEGDPQVLDWIYWNDGLDQYQFLLLLSYSRSLKIWMQMLFAFQLHNLVHNGHALLMQDTHRQLLERGYSCPVLLLHPLGGWTRDDDVPLRWMKKHAALLRKESWILRPQWWPPSHVPWFMLNQLRSSGIVEHRWLWEPTSLHCWMWLCWHALSRNRKELYEQTHGTQMLTSAPGLIILEIVPLQVAAYNKKKRGRWTTVTLSTMKTLNLFLKTQKENLPKKPEISEGFMLLRPGLGWCST